MTESKPNFTACRVEKIRSLVSLGKRSNHNNRTAEAGLEHTDPNRGTGLLFGSQCAKEALHKRLEACNIDRKKLRRDAVLAFEFVAWNSPEWWDTATIEQQKEWFERTRSFVEKQWGKENVLQCYVHLDEKTPHPHFIIAPVVEKEIKKRGRKGRPGTITKEHRLCARDFIGGSSKEMEKLQTDFAEEMEGLGLHRGIPKKETGARNKNPAKWRAENAAELDKQKKITQQAEDVLAQANETNQETAKIWAKWHDVGQHIKGIANRLGWASFEMPEMPNPQIIENTKNRLTDLKNKRLNAERAKNLLSQQNAEQQRQAIKRREEQAFAKRLGKSLTNKNQIR